MGLLYEQQDHVVTITLNRPEAMNAIDPETHGELIDAWMRFRDDSEAWVAILTGAGFRRTIREDDYELWVRSAVSARPAGLAVKDLADLPR